MPVTYNSSIGSQLSISSGDPDATDDYELFTETHETAVSMGDMPAQSDTGTAVQVAADATAFGTDTLAAINADVSVVEGAGATATHVNVDALAVAQADEDIAFASTFVDVSYAGGGGPYLSITHNSTSMEVEDGTTTVESSSSLALVVIELDGGGSGETVQDPSSQTVAGPDDDGLAHAPPPGDDCGCLDDGPGDYAIDGNLAVFDVQAVAVGDNSYADLVVDAVALEDTMSTVTLITDVAVG